jgi:hypothetical protein
MKTKTNNWEGGMQRTPQTETSYTQDHQHYKGAIGAHQGTKQKQERAQGQSTDMTGKLGPANYDFVLIVLFY